MFGVGAVARLEELVARPRARWAVYSISTLMRAGALVRVDKDWLVFPSALSGVSAPLFEKHMQASVAALEGALARVMRRLGNVARPTPKADLRGVEEREALDALIDLELVNESMDGDTVEVAGATVLRELWPPEEFEIELI